MEWKRKRVRVSAEIQSQRHAIAGLKRNMVEPVGSGGQMTTLTNYIAEPFWNASGLAHNARVFDPGISEAITMYDDNNVGISYPTLLGNTAFLLQDANTAR